MKEKAMGSPDDRSILATFIKPMRFLSLAALAMDSEEDQNPLEILKVDVELVSKFLVGIHENLSSKSELFTKGFPTKEAFVAVWTALHGNYETLLQNREKEYAKAATPLLTSLTNTVGQVPTLQTLSIPDLEKFNATMKPLGTEILSKSKEVQELLAAVEKDSSTMQLPMKTFLACYDETLTSFSAHSFETD